MLSFQPTVIQPKQLSPKNLEDLGPKELGEYVSHYIGTYNDEPIYFEKKIIIKDDNLNSLEGRITELLRFEDTKRVIFGVFNVPEEISAQIITIFEAQSRRFIKETGRKKALGRIWCIEINGSGKGCGVIAADDRIRIWKDI